VTRLKAAFGVALCACAASVNAQVVPTLKDPTSQQFPTRVPRGGVAPILDMRIQDDGLALPKGLQEQQSGEAPKAEEKPAARPEPRSSEPPALPSPPR
jgi:hypothetical protein